MFNPQLPVQSAQKMPVSITLSYLGLLSIKLSKNLNNIIRKFCTLKFSFAVCSIINVQLVHISPKDQIPLMVLSNIIYKYTCVDSVSPYILVKPKDTS